LWVQERVVWLERRLCAATARLEEDRSHINILPSTSRRDPMTIAQVILACYQLTLLSCTSSNKGRFLLINSTFGLVDYGMIRYLDTTVRVP
jgi:hypothetical protein